MFDDAEARVRTAVKAAGYELRTYDFAPLAPTGGSTFTPRWTLTVIPIDGRERAKFGVCVVIASGLYDLLAYIKRLPNIH